MSPRLSVVVVAYGIERELPRTLYSLSTQFQRGIAADDYETIVVDNGSPRPVELADAGERVRVLRIDDAPRSPARAANVGVEAARGELVCLIVDGARLASPGLLRMALLSAGLSDRPVISAPAYHLGDAPQMRSVESGYDQEVEDRLLEESGWREDGYRLFSICALAGSSGRGWFGPMGESSSLFMPAAMWNELGGLDERFDLPGGGLVNHDLYRRASQLHGAELVTLLGEGTFHQFHGGAATSGRFGWDDMHEQYVHIRGQPYAPPAAAPLLVGHIPTTARQHLLRSAEWLARR